MNQFMKMAADEARSGIRQGHGGPFGCVIVKENTVIGRGHNEVVRRNDPTCHGEMMAIRDACQRSETFDLSGCVLFTTAQPCPMCAAAIRWANIGKVYYGCSIADTDALGFRDQQLYRNPERIDIELDREECLTVFQEYRMIQDKIHY